MLVIITITLFSWRRISGAIVTCFHSVSGLHLLKGLHFGGTKVGEEGGEKNLVWSFFTPASPMLAQWVR